MSYPLACNICYKSFSGPQSATQHFTSTEHSHKANFVPVPGLSCLACRINCDTTKILRKHEISQRHLATVQKQHSFDSRNPRGNISVQGSVGNIQQKTGEYDVGQCTLCGVIYTSQQQAHDHLRGKAHIKKQTQWEARRNSGRSRQPQHDVRPFTNQNGWDRDDTAEKLLYVRGNDASPISSRHPAPPSNNNHGNNNDMKCDLCNVTFSGPYNAEQHYSGEKHRRNMQQKTNLSVPGAPNACECTVCKVQFTGLESKSVHMASEKHKKKILLAQKEARGEVLPLQCNACQKTFTGQESAEQHFASSKHNQTIRNNEIKANNTEIGRNVEASARGFKQSYDIFQTITKPSTYQPHQSLSHDDDEILAKPFSNHGTDRTSLTAANTPPVTFTEATTPNIGNVKQLDRYSYCNEQTVQPSHVGIPTDDFTKADHNIHFQPLTLDDNDYNESNANENFNYVHNQLNSAHTSIGRGRGLFSLLDPGNRLLTSKQNNTAASNTVTSLASLKSSIVEKGDEGTEKGTAFGKRDFTPGHTDSVPRTEAHAPFTVGTRKETTLSTRPFDVGRIDNGLQPEAHRPFTVDTKKNTVFGQRSFDVGQIDNGLRSAIHAQTAGFTNFNQQTRSSVGFSEQTASVISHQDKAHTSADTDYIFEPSTGRGKCFVCDVDLTSVALMRQHLSGQKHNRAKAVKEQMVNGLPNSPLVCAVCTVTFSGFEARDQHMNSERHLAKLNAILMGKTEYFCDVCKVPCSGPDSYKQHLAGAQHLKKTGMETSDLTAALNFDRTQWYPCDVCKCKMNTHEQLMIHMQSPKHLKQLEKTTPTQGAFHQPPQMNSSDRTVWHHCHVCNCDMNTAEQLRIHEASPIHIAKARKGKSYQPDRMALARPVSQTSAFTSTALESFLSEPLFPDHMMSHLEQSDSSSEISQAYNSETSQADGLNFDDLLECPGPKEDLHFDDLLECPDQGANGGGSSGQRGNATLGSDIAWAMRSRGARESRTNDRRSSSDRSAHDDHEHLGARPKQLDPTTNNPYAVTHPFYCHTCKAPMNTRQAYEIHLKGKRHMQKVCVEPAPLREHRRAEGGQYPACTKTPARRYQQELFGKAMATDTLCFLPTGTGKTLVAIMTMSAMLNKYPTKNVLFLVDKVLLVLQQSKQIIKEIGETKFVRFNPDSDTCLDTQRRELCIASVCMGQQNTNGVPLWQHDVVVVTADFCRNLMDKEILRWTDFSLVVFDEAHHCDKGHPFNTLLTNYHQQVTNIEDRPKILGLTASPAGKADIPKTYQMLLKLVDNMGKVGMSVVEEPDNVAILKQFQSNAEMIIRSPIEQGDNSVRKLLHEFNVYITYCVIKLRAVSNIVFYVNCKNEVYQGMSDNDIRKMADGFVDRNIDMIQSSIGSLQCSANVVDKIQLSYLGKHVQSICMAWSSLLEGGELCARQELDELKSTEWDFNFAKSLGLPTDNLVHLLHLEDTEFDSMFQSLQDVESAIDVNIRRLLNELTSLHRSAGQSISLILVKQRGTAILISKVLQNSSKMRKLGLKTTYVVGHGGSGSNDKGMSVNQQKRVLEEIKQFKYQIVVATSVAEEGVDWPKCDCVISMYPPTTVTALVQMRGRARQKGSKFIILCSSQEEETKLNDIMQREANMIAATQMLIQERRNN